MIQRDECSSEACVHRYLPRSAHSTAASGSPLHLVYLRGLQRYVSVAEGGSLHLWASPTLEPLRTAPAAGGMVSSVFFDAVLGRLVLGTAHGRLLLYDAATLRPQSGEKEGLRLGDVAQSLGRFDDRDSQGDAMPVSLLVGGQRGRVRLLDWAALLRGELSVVVDAAAHDGWVDQLEWQKPLNGLLSCSTDGTVVLWDLGDKKLTARHTLRNPSGRPVAGFVWVASQGLLATRSGCERTVHLWLPGVAEPVASLAAHPAPVTHLVLDEVNHQLLSRSKDCTVRVWDLRTHRCVQTLTPPEGSRRAACMLHDPEEKAVVVAESLGQRGGIAQHGLARNLSLSTAETATQEGDTAAVPGLPTQGLVGLICNPALDLV